jgi:sporulation protein YlmC with PRC-barrel domain
MLKSRFALGLVGSMLLAGPALAQTAPTAPPPAPAAQPASKFDTNGWLTQEKAGQWRASKLKGLNVYNPGNDKIGDIEDVMINANGGIDAIVVSVGGFLGMGEHYVAVPFKSFQWVDRDRRPVAMTPGGAVETTGSTTKPAPAATAVPYPDHAVLNATKEQLKAAPQFTFAK